MLAAVQSNHRHSKPLDIGFDHLTKVTLLHLHPCSKPMLAAVQANHRHWKSCQLAAVTTDESSSSSARSLKAGSASSHHLMTFKIPQDLQDPAHTDSSKIHVEVK